MNFELNVDVSKYIKESKLKTIIPLGNYAPIGWNKEKRNAYERYVAYIHVLSKALITPTPEKPRQPVDAGVDFSSSLTPLEIDLVAMQAFVESNARKNNNSTPQTIIRSPLELYDFMLNADTRNLNINPAQADTYSLTYATSINDFSGLYTDVTDNESVQRLARSIAQEVVTKKLLTNKIKPDIEEFEDSFKNYTVNGQINKLAERINCPPYKFQTINYELGFGYPLVFDAARITRCALTEEAENIIKENNDHIAAAYIGDESKYITEKSECILYPNDLNNINKKKLSEDEQRFGATLTGDVKTTMGARIRMNVEKKYEITWKEGSRGDRGYIK